MAKSEKVAYILDQVRLCLAKGDHARAQILARKVSPRAFVPKKGEEKGQIGIEGTAIEEAEEVRQRERTFLLLPGGFVFSEQGCRERLPPSLSLAHAAPPIKHNPQKTK